MKNSNLYFTYFTPVSLKSIISNIKKKEGSESVWVVNMWQALSREQTESEWVSKRVTGSQKFIEILVAIWHALEILVEKKPYDVLSSDYVKP